MINLTTEKLDAIWDKRATEPVPLSLIDVFMLSTEMKALVMNSVLKCIDDQTKIMPEIICSFITGIYIGYTFAQSENLEKLIK